MTPLAAAVAALLLAVLPVAVDRWAGRRASPASLVALAALGGLLLLPLALAACLVLRSAHEAPTGGRAALVGAAALGALTGGRTLLHWARVRRLWRSIGAAVDSSRVSVNGTVTVVPLAEPTAFVAGRRLVVSTALLEALPEEEAEAVLAHEEAHLHGRHSRVALAAQALSRGVFRILRSVGGLGCSSSALGCRCGGPGAVAGCSHRAGGRVRRGGHGGPSDRAPGSGVDRLFVVPVPGRHGPQRLGRS